jgi:uncharacterized membrane protein YebE (DUF533 family)
MFDAKNLLESLVRGANQGSPAQAGNTGSGGGLADILGQLGQAMGQQGGQPGAARAPASSGGGLGDILGQLGQAMGQPRAAGAPGAGAPGAAPSGGSLEDILRNLLPSNDTGRPAAPNVAPASGTPTAPAAPGAAAGSGAGDGGLGDILGKLQQQLGQGGGGGLFDVLGQILGQATQGVKEGAQRVDQATGASGAARDALGKATGQSPEDIFNQLKELIQNNQMAAGAAAGGLGSILLGTKAGRSIAASALKIGGLALIGGLAYKALQNYQQGKPLITGAQQLALAEAPAGSGFETSAVTNDAAVLYIRGMIAAAAADGRIDAKEQQKILADMQDVGFGPGAEEFLAKELNNPATVDELVAAVTSPEEAVQLFTAARVAIDLDNQEEHDFLVSLASKLGLDGNLVAHIDAAARAAA